MAHHGLPEDEDHFAEEGIPEQKKSQRMLMLLLLLLILLFAYLYFFTSLIRPRPQAPPPAKPAAEAPVVKKPMPARVTQPQGEAGAPVTAAAGKEGQAPGQPRQGGQPPAAKVAPGEKPGAAPESKAAKPGAGPAKMPMPASGQAKAGKPAGEATAARPGTPEAKAGKPAAEAKPGKGAVSEAKGAKGGAAAPGKAAAPPEKGKGAATAEKKGAKVAEAKPAEGKAVQKEAAAAKARTAEAAKAKPAAKPAAARAAAAGGYALEINGELAASEVAPMLSKLKKAGVAGHVVKTTTHKSERMHRLFLADFANRDEAQEELERLKLAAPEAFMLRENGRYAVYAGSYMREGKAAVEQDRLYEKGVKLLMKTANASVPVVKLRAGSFPAKGNAVRAAETLKKAGVAATVVKVGK